MKPILINELFITNSTNLFILLKWVFLFFSPNLSPNLFA